MNYLTHLLLAAAIAAEQQVSNISTTSKPLFPNLEPDIHLHIDHPYLPFWSTVRVYSSRITTSCETLPKVYWNQISLVKNEKCVLLFSQADCKGTNIRVEPGSNHLKKFFKNDLDSFRSCDDVSKDSPYRDFRIQFYEKKFFSDPLVDIPIKNGCKNLPLFAKNKASSVKTDVCVILYSNSNCPEDTRQYKLEKGDWGKLEDIDDDVESFMPCNNSEVMLPTEVKLSINIFKIKIEAENETSSTIDLAMSSTQTFLNNGSSILKEKYSVTKEIAETISVEKVVGNSYTDSYSVEGDAGIELGGSLLKVIELQFKLAGALRKTYNNETTSSNSSTYTIETKTAFHVEKDVELQPCTQSRLVSKVKVSKNIPLKYIAHAYVTGYKNWVKISASEIKEKLPSDMTYVRDRDENTIEVEFTKRMTADIGLETETVVNDSPVAGCINGCDVDAGFFKSASGCQQCSDACQTCNGSGDDKCILCKKGFENNGKCVESCPFDMENIRGACKGKENVYVAGVGGIILLVLGVGFGIVLFKMRSNKDNNTKGKQKYIVVDKVDPEIGNSSDRTLEKTP